MPTEKRARQRENREKLLAARARVERIERLKRRGIVLAVILIIVAIFAWLTNRDTGDPEPSATVATVATVATTLPSQTRGPVDYAGFRAQTTACEGTQPAERVEMTFEAPADQALSGSVQATLQTSCGSIELALDADAAPESVNSFVFLAREGYFDGTACHRLVPGFVLQCGDPGATGGGDPGYVVPDEFPADGFLYDTGVIAMANAGPGTTGSQFFLVIVDGSLLPPLFSVLGTFTVSDGTLAALAQVPLGLSPGGEQSGPLETIYLDSVVVEE